MTHDEIYEGRVARDKRNYPGMTHGGGNKMSNVVYLINGPRAGERIAIADGTKTIEVLTYVQGCTHFIMPNIQKITYIHHIDDQWKTVDGADYKEGICPDCIVEARARHAKREKELARQGRWYRKLWKFRQTFQELGQ